MRLLITILPVLLLTFGIASAEPPNKAAVKRIKLAASDYIKDGFKLREDFWKGSSAPGKRHVVKQQLFRGNEYWFWLGSETSETRLAVKVYDDKGRPVDVETKSEKGWAAARVLPPRTGTYTIVFVAEKNPAIKEFAWSMTYGYR